MTIQTRAASPANHIAAALAYLKQCDPCSVSPPEWDRLRELGKVVNKLLKQEKSGREEYDRRQAEAEARRAAKQRRVGLFALRSAVRGGKASKQQVMADIDSGKLQLNQDDLDFILEAAAPPVGAATSSSISRDSA